MEDISKSFFEELVFETFFLWIEFCLKGAIHGN